MEDDAPDNDSEFDPEQLVKWLDKCKATHDQGCRAPADSTDQQGTQDSEFLFEERLTSNFRLLDVDRGCIESASLDTRYVALSYVCDLPSMAKLNKSNYERWSTEGALEAMRAQLPATINDAINLVQSVGERYLWVDALCLLHDDEDDLDVGISLTSSVFQGAYFTIAATIGTDANAGLWKRKLGTTDSVQRTPADELKLDAMDNFISTLLGSAYRARAWTLAELSLSQRAVIFTDDQVFFCCHRATWSDRPTFSSNKYISWRERDGSPIGHIPDPPEGILLPLVAYARFSSHFSRRTLRNDGDVLRAFHGISRPLFGAMKTTATEGLPGYYINAFLLFVSEFGKSCRRPEFASFSWAGWDGWIAWPLDSIIARPDENWTPKTALGIIKWLKWNALVEWSEVTPSGDVHQLYQPRIREASALANFVKKHADVFPDSTTNLDDTPGDLVFGSSKSGRLDMVDWDTELQTIQGASASAPGTGHTRFPRWAFDLVQSRGEFNRLLRKMPNLNDKVVRSWAATRAARLRKLQESDGKAVHPSSAVPFRRPRLSGQEEETRQFNDPRAVCARNCQHDSAHVPIPKFPPYSVLQGMAIHLRLRLGQALSATASDQTTASHAPVQLQSVSQLIVGSLRPDNTESLPAPGSEVDLVVIGHTSGSKPRSMSRRKRKRFIRPPDILWVLYVEWHDGIAERRGVGQISTSALEDALPPGPVVKRILLG